MKFSKDPLYLLITLVTVGYAVKIATYPPRFLIGMTAAILFAAGYSSLSHLKARKRP